MKRRIVLLLALAIALSLIPTAFAKNVTCPDSDQHVRDNKVYCPVCKGNCKERCPYCFYAEEPGCEYCEYGRIDCSRCGATGLIDCPTCGGAGIVHEHDFSEDWTYDEFEHWHVAICEHDWEICDQETHYDDDCDLVCDVCGAKMQKGPDPEIKPPRKKSAPRPINYATFEPVEGKYMVVGDSVNMRAEPSTRYRIIAIYHRGDLLEGVKGNGSWMELKDSETGRVGYMYCEYLQEYTEPASETDEAKEFPTAE